VVARARKNISADTRHLSIIRQLVVTKSADFMAGKKAISVSQFAEHFRRAWLGTQEKFHSGRSLDRNDFNQLPRKLGKKPRLWSKTASFRESRY
jgi:hypothetical protein